jgi:uncharacterized protein (TIGR02145 family)
MIFVSYCTKDKEIAFNLVDCLEKSDIRCWIAPRDIPAGSKWAGEIMKALDEAEMLILVLSEQSNNSDQVLTELETAKSRRIPIIPVFIEDVKLTVAVKYFIQSHQWLDAKGDRFGEAVEGLIESIEKFQLQAIKNNPLNQNSVAPSMDAKAQASSDPSGVEDVRKPLETDKKINTQKPENKPTGKNYFPWIILAALLIVLISWVIWKIAQPVAPILEVKDSIPQTTEAKQEKKQKEPSTKTFPSTSGTINKQSLPDNVQIGKYIVFEDKRDGMKYFTVKIGHKLWFADNLNYDAGDEAETLIADPGGVKFGRFYPANLVQSACPQGWRIPSQADWDDLLNTLGTNSRKALLEGGTSGFKAFLAGFINLDGQSKQKDTRAYFWASNAGGELPNKAFMLDKYFESQRVYPMPKVKMNIRCVKDAK